MCSFNVFIFIIAGHINLGKKGYRVPPKGTIQVTLFNPLGTVVKMFVVMYDLSDMPPNSQTFLRQRTLYMPSEGVNDAELQKWLRYLVHLRYEQTQLHSPGISGIFLTQLIMTYLWGQHIQESVSRGIAFHGFTIFMFFFSFLEWTTKCQLPTLFYIS